MLHDRYDPTGQPVPLLPDGARPAVRQVGIVIMWVAAGIGLVEVTGATFVGDTAVTVVFGSWLGLSGAAWQVLHRRLGWFTAAAAVASVWAAVSAAAATWGCGTCAADAPRHLALAGAATPLALAVTLRPAPAAGRAGRRVAGWVAGRLRRRG